MTTAITALLRPTFAEAARDALDDPPASRLPLTGPCLDPWCADAPGRHLHPAPGDVTRLCFGCDFGFPDDDLVSVDGTLHCGPCARAEVGDDDLSDRVRDL